MGGLLDRVNRAMPTAHDLYACELVLDLWDLVHMARVGREPVTIGTFARIRGMTGDRARPGVLPRIREGVADERSVRCVLARVRALLAVRGIDLATTEPLDAGKPGARQREERSRMQRVEILFDVDALERLVKPDLSLACRLLRVHRARVLGSTTDRGRVIPGSTPGARARRKGRQLGLWGVSE